MILKLVDKEHLVDNVWAFRFEPGETLTWTAGQFIYVELQHPNPDTEGTKRWFTVSSPPYEKIIQITTRVTDSTFKHALSKLNIGDALELIDKPDGDFVWEDSEPPIIFIAGGIGITPYYSILKQRVRDNLPLKVTLLYANRTNDIPFKAEIDHWTENDTQFSVQYIIGERLTASKIAELQPDINRSQVYISGPEPLVETLGDQLKEQGLPDEHLRQDFFPNYTENNY